MRKRVFAFIVCISVLLCLAACSEGGNNPPTTFSDGSFTYYSGDNLSYSMKTVPFDMVIEEKTVPFHKASFFELYVDHGYTAYLVISLDRANLSDDDIYWLTKYDDKKFYKTLDVNVYANSEKNQLQTESLHLMGIVYDDDYIYYSYCSDNQRYSFLNSSFSCQVIIVPTGLTESDTVYYHYTHTVDDSNYSDTIASLSTSEREAIVQAAED